MPESDLGPRKTLFVVVIVVGCFAVLWPKVFYPMLIGPTQKPNDLDQGVRQERPAHLRPEMLHPALREKGRAIPAMSHSGPRKNPPPKIVEGRPGPIPGVRPPMGAAGHVVPPPQKGNSISVIMPIYTIGIVIFFTYTLMKVIFKKKPEGAGCGLYPPIESDRNFRREVFESERSQLSSRFRHSSGSGKLGVDELDILRRRLRETELAMERIMAQMAQVPLGSQNLASNGSVPGAKPQEVKQQDQTSVKVLGMEMTASCEGGQRWSRPGSPIVPPSPPPTEPAEPPQSIFLEGALPAQSQLLVSDSKTETQPSADSAADPAVVLASKMTLSVISLDSLPETENGGSTTSSGKDREEYEFVNKADIKNQNLEDVYNGLSEVRDEFMDDSKYLTASGITNAEHDLSEGELTDGEMEIEIDDDGYEINKHNHHLDLEDEILHQADDNVHKSIDNEKDGGEILDQTHPVHIPEENIENILEQNDNILLQNNNISRSAPVIDDDDDIYAKMYMAHAGADSYLLSNLNEWAHIKENDIKASIQDSLPKDKSTIENVAEDEMKKEEIVEVRKEEIEQIKQEERQEEPEKKEILELKEDLGKKEVTEVQEEAHLGQRKLIDAPPKEEIIELKEEPVQKEVTEVKEEAYLEQRELIDESPKEEILELKEELGKEEITEVKEEEAADLEQRELKDEPLKETIFELKEEPGKKEVDLGQRELKDELLEAGNQENELQKTNEEELIKPKEEENEEVSHIKEEQNITDIRKEEPEQKQIAELKEVEMEHSNKEESIIDLRKEELGKEETVELREEQGVEKIQKEVSNLNEEQYEKKEELRKEETAELKGEQKGEETTQMEKLNEEKGEKREIFEIKKEESEIEELEKKEDISELNGTSVKKEESTVEKTKKEEISVINEEQRKEDNIEIKKEEPRKAEIIEVDKQKSKTKKTRKEELLDKTDEIKEVKPEEPKEKEELSQIKAEEVSKVKKEGKVKKKGKSKTKKAGAADIKKEETNQAKENKSTEDAVKSNLTTQQSQEVAAGILEKSASQSEKDKDNTKATEEHLTSQTDGTLRLSEKTQTKFTDQPSTQISLNKQAVNPDNDEEVIEEIIYLPEGVKFNEGDLNDDILIVEEIVLVSDDEPLEHEMSSDVRQTPDDFIRSDAVDGLTTTSHADLSHLSKLQNAGPSSAKEGVQQKVEHLISSLEAAKDLIQEVKDSPTEEGKEMKVTNLDEEADLTDFDFNKELERIKREMSEYGINVEDSDENQPNKM